MAWRVALHHHQQPPWTRFSPVGWNRAVAATATAVTALQFLLWSRAPAHLNAGMTFRIGQKGEEVLMQGGAFLILAVMCGVEGWVGLE